MYIEFPANHRWSESLQNRYQRWCARAYKQVLRLRNSERPGKARAWKLLVYNWWFIQLSHFISQWGQRSLSLSIHPRKPFKKTIFMVTQENCVTGLHMSCNTILHPNSNEFQFYISTFNVVFHKYQDSELLVTKGWVLI